MKTETLRKYLKSGVPEEECTEPEELHRAVAEETAPEWAAEEEWVAEQAVAVSTATAKLK